MSNHATAVWNGTLKEGAGELNLPKANVQTAYDFQSRFETGNTTNPEELRLPLRLLRYLSALFTNEGGNTQVKTTKVTGWPKTTRMLI